MEIFEFTGAFGSRPTSSFTPFDQGAIVARMLAESMLLKGKLVTRYDLETDAVVPVIFGGVTNAHIVVLEASSRVAARLTSAEGALQAIPVDGLLVLMSESEPFTAIDIARAAGVSTTVQVFLGERP